MSAPVSTSAPTATRQHRGQPGRGSSLLDGHSLAYRAFFALPVENFQTTTGQPTNAVYGFTSMLINLLRDEQPTHVGGRVRRLPQTFRTAEYAEYKAGPLDDPDRVPRPGPPDPGGARRAARSRSSTAEGYEADDVIATLTDAGAPSRGFDVLICTGDRDAFQLVSEQVHGAVPAQRRLRPCPASPRRRSGPAYGLSPAQYPDFAALRGDPSDNLPSIPGVGEKTAAKWVRSSAP